MFSLLLCGEISTNKLLLMVQVCRFGPRNLITCAAKLAALT